MLSRRVKRLLGLTFPFVGLLGGVSHREGVVGVVRHGQVVLGGVSGRLVGSVLVFSRILVVVHINCDLNCRMRGARLVDIDWVRMKVKGPAVIGKVRRGVVRRAYLDVASTAVEVSAGEPREEVPESGHGAVHELAEGQARALLTDHRAGALRVVRSYQVVAGLTGREVIEGHGALAFAAGETGAILSCHSRPVVDGPVAGDSGSQ